MLARKIPDLFDTPLTKERGARVRTGLSVAHGIAIRDAAFAAGRKYGRFTSDQMREFLPDLTAAWLAMRPNRAGAVFTQMEKAGEIRFVSYVKSTRPEARGRDIKLWELT